MNRHRIGQRGFTLVELLVVIAIIGILVALLLPAVQSAREAARRIQCSNNVKQLGLAMHNYESTHSVLPFGWNQHGTGWSAMILPYIEQQNVYDTLTFSENGAGNWYTGDNERACEIVIDAFRCPSMPLKAHFNYNGISKRVPTSYRGCASSTATSDDPSTAASGTTWLDNDENQDGLLFAHRSVAFSEVRDGLTNTILIGESYTDPEFTQDRQGMDYWYIGSPQVDSNATEFTEFCGSTAAPINSRLDASANGYIKEISFGSYHPAGAMFAAGDGSVHFLSETIDPDIYIALGSRAGGEIASIKQ